MIKNIEEIYLREFGMKSQSISSGRHETIHLECVETEKVRIKRALPDLPEGNTRPRWSLACEYTCVLDWDGTHKVTFSQRRASSRREGYC